MVLQEAGQVQDKENKQTLQNKMIYRLLLVLVRKLDKQKKLESPKGQME